jgi:hypothetical protein
VGGAHRIISIFAMELVAVGVADKRMDWLPWP